MSKSKRVEDIAKEFRREIREEALRHWVRHPDGKIEQVDLMTWAVWFEKSDAGRFVEFTEFPNGSFLSSTFTGLPDVESQIFGGDPIMFTTGYMRKLVKPRKTFGLVVQHTLGAEWKWKTEEDARRGHAIIKARILANPDVDLEGFDPLGAS